MAIMHPETTRSTLEPGFFHGAYIHTVSRERRTAYQLERAFRCVQCSRTRPRAVFTLIQSGADRDIISGVCQDCEKDAWAQPAFKAFPGLRPFCLHITAAITRDAARNGRLIAVTAVQLAEVYAEQAGRCALTGVALNFDAGRGEQNGRKASLDRIQPRDGFVADNVQWISWASFRIKSASKLSNDALIRLARQIAQEQQRREALLLDALT